MKVRATSNQYGDHGFKQVGDEFTVSASYGKGLIDKGIAEEVDEDEKVEIEEEKEKAQVTHTPKKKK